MYTTARETCEANLENYVEENVMRDALYFHFLPFGILYFKVQKYCSSKNNFQLRAQVYQFRVVCSHKTSYLPWSQSFW
jgi:hypothetical protein